MGQSPHDQPTENSAMKALPVLCTIGTLTLATVAGCQTLFVTADDDPSTAPPSTFSDPPAPTPTTEPTVATVTVDYVIDGDTIRANVDGRDESIRLLGIDTPELGRDGDPDEKCAQEAKRFLTSWISGSTVTVTTDPNSPDRDPYDRLLAYVDMDDVDVSYVMLDDGWADLYTSNPDITRWSTYTEAVDERIKPRCAVASSER